MAGSPSGAYLVMLHTPHPRRDKKARSFAEHSNRLIVRVQVYFGHRYLPHDMCWLFTAVCLSICCGQHRTIKVTSKNLVNFVKICGTRGPCA